MLLLEQLPLRELSAVVVQSCMIHGTGFQVMKNRRMNAKDTTAHHRGRRGGKRGPGSLSLHQLLLGDLALLLSLLCGKDRDRVPSEGLIQAGVVSVHRQEGWGGRARKS